MNTLSSLNDQECRVSVISEQLILKGTLGIPAGARGIVLFAHGSNSSRHCPQNRYIAQVLRQAKFATLLLDLLTQAEEANYPEDLSAAAEFEQFAERLVGATDWLLQNPLTQHLNLGYFGNNTGASAALIAASKRPEVLRALVCCNGSPDLTPAILSQIQASTLLIVGEKETTAIAENQSLLGQLRTARQLEIVSGATHTFREPGTLDHLAQLVHQWFDCHLVS